MSKEAMKLALEHAKRDERHANHAETRYWCRMYRDIAEKAVEALAKPDFWEGYVPEPVKPATEESSATQAQQALDKKAENARELGLDYEPAKDNSNYRFDPPGLDPSHQKPVAWWIPKAKQFCLPSSDGTRPFAKAWEPLYTSPPEQRKPLTDEEIDAATQAWAGAVRVSLNRLILCREFARAIEAAHGIKENV